MGADTIDPEAKLTYTNEVVFGFEREIMANTTFGVRYVYRNMPQVLEDIANCPMVAYELAQTSSICSNVEYILTNPSSDIPVAAGTEFLGAAVRRSGPQVQLARVHAEPPRRELVDDDVVPLLAGCAATSKGSTATTTGSPIRASRRSTTSRPTTRATRRSTRGSTRATSASSATRTASCRSTVRTR